MLYAYMKKQEPLLFTALKYNTNIYLKPIKTHLSIPYPIFNRGSNMIFHSLTYRKVSREVLKIEVEALGFQPSRGSLRM